MRREGEGCYNRVIQRVWSERGIKRVSVARIGQLGWNSSEGGIIEE